MSTVLTSGLVKFIASSALRCGFDDVCNPMFSQAEYGICTLTRKMQGASPLLNQFLSGLIQGQKFIDLSGSLFQQFINLTSSSATGFYLQSWAPDDDPVFPTVTLVYKGLSGPLPQPYGETVQSLQSCSISGQSTDDDGNPNTVTRDIQYYASGTNWKAVSTRRPKPNERIYTDISGSAPEVIKSVIRDDKGNVFAGEDAPARYVTATTPAQIVRMDNQSCSPIWGTPYFDFEETDSTVFVS